MDSIRTLCHNLVEIRKSNRPYRRLTGLTLHTWPYLLTWNSRGALSSWISGYPSVPFLSLRTCKILRFSLKCTKCNTHYMYTCVITRSYCCKKVVDLTVTSSKHNLCKVKIYLTHRICSWYVDNVWRSNCKFHDICFNKYWWINKSVHTLSEQIRISKSFWNLYT